MSTQPTRRGLRATLSLEYPMSLGVYDSYDDAQRAVDYLSDHEFPVQDVLIVGTDLKQLERVTGRLTRGRVVVAGALSGMWLGLFVGTIFALFDPSGFNIVAVLGTVAPVGVVSRNAFQDAHGRGLGINEYEPEGKAAQEIRELWGWLARKVEKLAP